MTNTVTLKIGSASTGRDYATFAAAWAAIPNDLVAADVSYILEPYNDSEFTLTSTFNMTGKTTDAGHTILVRPAAGHSFEDNANVLTNALRYNLANGVGINAGLYQIINQNAYTTIEGLQVRGGISNNVSPSGFVVNSYDTAVIQNCLVEYSGADARSDMTINSAFGSSVHRGIFRNIVIVLTTANSNGVRM